MTLELVRSDSFGLLPAPAARLFGSPGVLASQTTEAVEAADAEGQSC